jgi:uncharacterized membrane protein
MVLLPILVTVWIIRWLYTTLEYYVIGPLAGMVVWKVLQLKGTSEAAPWFENYVAPVIAVILALAILYCCGVLAHSRLRRMLDETMLRVPLVSQIYDSVRNVIQCFEKPTGKPTPQRVVLVAFPHPGMRLPAIVTSSCRDGTTAKTILCVYVPTTPIPTSGFFLMVPEEDVTELNWDVQQTLQAIISGGLTAPPEVTYYRTALAAAAPAGGSPVAGQVASPEGRQG